MIQFRPFLNDDIPGLAELWSNDPPLRALVRPMTASLLERFVLSKLYFDRRGLIVAEEAQRIVGFAHAGFGPNDDATWIGTRVGVVSMVMVAPRDDEDAIARALIGHCETYLGDAGAQQVYAGGCYPNSPFYQGLYGGSEQAGILASDVRRNRWILAAGYQTETRRRILDRSLADLRPVTNRQQLMIRRRCRLETILDPRPKSWWEANRAAQHDLTQFQLVSIQGGTPLAWATFWDLEPMAASWGMHAAGLLEMETAHGQGEEGVDTFLLCESLRQLQTFGVSLVEAHVGEHDTQRQRLLDEVGFRDVDFGVVYVKSLTM